MTSAISNRPPAQRFKKGLDCQDKLPSSRACLLAARWGCRQTFRTMRATSTPGSTC